MMTQHNEMQIVFVSDGFRLVDAGGRERTYRRRDGLPLAGGYYVVSWPPGSEPGSFDEKAVFRGPFKRRREAETNLERFKTLVPCTASGHAGRAPMPARGASIRKADHGLPRHGL